MEIKVSKSDAELTILPIGRIDSLTSDELESSIKNALEDDVTKLIIDMEQVQFVSSKGIRILLTLHKEMASRGQMVLKNINNSVKEVLRLSALLSVFTIE